MGVAHSSRGVKGGRTPGRAEWNDRTDGESGVSGQSAVGVLEREPAEMELLELVDVE